MDNHESLELFASGKMPNFECGWQLYQKSVDFKTAINLFDTVKVNENFFIGKQWEGVDAKGLPTPTFNIIKRVVSFITATITSDNIRVNAQSLSNVVDGGEMPTIVDIVNRELSFVFERNRVPALTRKFTTNAAVDGDGCTYTYWDSEAETGQAAKGAIKTEIINNRRVHFGNPNDCEVQSQPWIIIERREQVRKVKRRAKNNGVETWADIMVDDEQAVNDEVKRTDDKVTVLHLFWRDEDSGEIWAYEFTRTSAVTEPWPLGIKLYPITWLSWDRVQDCYHGQAMITGLIPNQIFINKMWSMSMLSMMRTAFPKYIYNNTLIARLDNRVGGAIGIPGGDINNVIKAVDPVPISPQVSQFIELSIKETESSLGATSVALGDTRPDNTSAIIALQRAAATPSEMTKQNIYDATEELSRIYFEFMGEYYGKRYVSITPTEAMREDAAAFGYVLPDKVTELFDFSILKQHPMLLKVDVGASTYYSEIASITTLDSLLRIGAISRLQYLERVPDDYIPNRRELIEEIRREEEEKRMMEQMMLQQQMMPAGMPPTPSPTPKPAPAPEQAKPDIPTGGGYSALQRKINEAGTTAGMI